LQAVVAGSGKTAGDCRPRWIKFDPVTLALIGQKMGPYLNSRMPWLVALVLALSVSAAALFLGQSIRSQAQLQEQVLLQVKPRSLNLANAMAGQMDGLFGSIDLALVQVRRAWLLSGRSAAFERSARQTLAALPAGLVPHMGVSNAEGDVVYGSPEATAQAALADGDNFHAHRAGGDQLVIGTPARSALDGRWTFTISRPLLREGRFDGTVHFTVSTDALALNLARLKLAPDDSVTLVHADGHLLARSGGNAQAMAQTAPPDLPFRSSPSEPFGVFHTKSPLDQVPRTYGWHRLPDSGAVLVVGIADSSVLAPLAPALRRGHWTAGVLALVLLSAGGLVAYSLWRVSRSQADAGLSEERLQEAQRLAHLGNWEYDVAGDRLLWSDEVYRIFGLDQAQTPISPAQFRQRMHPDDLAAMVRKFKDASGPGELHDATYRIVMPDGSFKYVRELWVKEFAGERFVRRRGTVQDVDEMHKAQASLLQLNEELEQRVQERTSELGAVNRDLEAFASSVSHDLRAPLRAIQGFATLLQEQCQDLPEEGQEFLKQIQGAAMRMGSLITDLLSMAHHSRAAIRRQRVSLSDLAQDLADELNREDPQRSVQWVIEEGLQVMADPVLMRVVLQNLLANAWKYSKNADQACISFSRTQHAQGVQEFCVRDNGAGFDMAYVEQLFQPFKRLHTQQQFEGSGVGLATVHRVVQRHGGTVRGEGAVGQGAQFYFTLPDAPAAQEPSEGE
jgi:signal transduction histidine kinase